MIGEILFLMLLGHCIGDYLFQTSWMAFNKKVKSKAGLTACVTHCIVYTSIVFATMFMSTKFLITVINQNILEFISIFILIFFSHFLLDRYHFVNWWTKTMGIRSWDSHIYKHKAQLSTNESINLTFGTFVYIMIDNTMHILLMYLIFKCFIISNT